MVSCARIVSVRGSAIAHGVTGDSDASPRPHREPERLCRACLHLASVCGWGP